MRATVARRAKSLNCILNEDLEVLRFWGLKGLKVSKNVNADGCGDVEM